LCWGVGGGPVGTRLEWLPIALTGDTTVQTWSAGPTPYVR